MEARRNAGVWGITRAFPIQFTWACSLAGRPTLKQEVELRAVSIPKITTSDAWNSANEQVFKALSSLQTVTVSDCGGRRTSGKLLWPIPLAIGSEIWIALHVLSRSTPWSSRSLSWSFSTASNVLNPLPSFVTADASDRTSATTPNPPATVVGRSLYPLVLRIELCGSG